MEQQIKQQALSELNYIPAMKFIFDLTEINNIFTYVGKDTFVLEKNNDNSIKEINAKDPEEEFKTFKDSKNKYDLILIDEDLENRWKWVNESFSKTNIILVHDTDNTSCNWSLVNKPDDFVWLDLKTYIPWTSIITNNKEIVSKAIELINAHIRT